MSYDFEPMSDEEIDSFGLVEDGIYNFEVIKSTRKISKSGNHMAELNIKFWDKEGKVHTLFDYLVFSKVGLNIKKVKHFCDSTGLQEKYKIGSIPEELGGYSGKFSVGVQEQQVNPNGGFYPKKNTVLDYVLTDLGSVKYEGSDKPFVDSELPF